MDAKHESPPNNGDQRLSNSTKEFRKGNLQHSCNSLDVDQRNASFAPLDPTDVGPIQAADVGKLLLRHPKLVAFLADRFAGPKPNIFHVLDGAYLSAVLLMCPRTTVQEY
jgi:hypothetical protein